MKIAVAGAMVGTVVFAAVVAAAVSSGSATAAATGQPVEPSGQMLAFSTPAGENHQQVTLVDPQRRVMCVYHVELKTGEIALKSVRNMTWDGQMLEFNTSGPTPREIRSQLGQQSTQQTTQQATQR